MSAEQWELIVEAVGPDGMVYGNNMLVQKEDVEDPRIFMFVVHSLCDSLIKQVGVYGTWTGRMRPCGGPERTGLRVGES